MSACWVPATFTATIGTPGARRADDLISRFETIRGETWGPFGINPADWSVTHLPTGRLMVVAESRAAARRFCREVASLIDWSTVKPGPIPAEIRDAVVTALLRAGGVMSTEAAP